MRISRSFTAIALATVAGVILFPLLLLVAVAAPIALLWRSWNRWRLRRTFLSRWGPEGKRVLLVYSNSPIWRDYIEEHWLPVYGAELVVLNWSERRFWPEMHPLEKRVFDAWAGTTEYNPLALGFLPGGGVEVIRFWRAFRDYKHGDELQLRRAEARLNELISIGVRPESS